MKNPCPTPHNSALVGDIAKVVLMPGDPLRAKFIAENFLENARLVNSVRNICGYTGTYKGKDVTVMASGMGMPSIGIYSYELFHFYGVELILRVGTAGAMQEGVKVGDMVLGMAACTDSSYGAQFGCNGTLAPICDYKTLQIATEIAQKEGMSYHVGNLLSSDVFYSAKENAHKCWAKMGVLAVEMEAAALYLNAAYAKKRALAICTASDHLLTGEATDAQTRQTAFTDMMRLALETAVATL